MSEVLERLIARFQEGTVIELTREEEEAIINSLTYEDFIDCGTSRAVYKFKEDYVVKVAMSYGGVNQNYIEKTYFNDIGNEYLANLYAHGMIINIMERVTDCTYYDSWGHDFTPEEEEEVSNLIDIVNDFTEYDGEDNKQIGFSHRLNAWVVYDYGYGLQDEYSHSEIVDNVDGWMCCISPLDNAKKIMDTLHIPTYDELSSIVGDYWKEQNEIEEEWGDYYDDEDYE